MAYQLSHIVYAGDFLKKKSSLINPNEFIWGTLFPDIRYSAGIDRKMTHERFGDVSLDFKGMDSFHAGWKFHLWCDKERTQYLIGRARDYGIDMDRARKEGELPYVASGLKLLEDWIYCSVVKNRKEILQTLSDVDIDFVQNAILPEIEISTEAVRRWFNIVRDYIAQIEYGRSVKGIFRAVSFSDDEIDKITKNARDFAEDKHVISAINSIRSKLASFY